MLEHNNFLKSSHNSTTKGSFRWMAIRHGYLIFTLCNFTSYLRNILHPSECPLRHEACIITLFTATILSVKNKQAELRLSLQMLEKFKCSSLFFQQLCNVILLLLHLSKQPLREEACIIKLFTAIIYSVAL